MFNANHDMVDLEYRVNELKEQLKKYEALPAVEPQREFQGLVPRPFLPEDFKKAEETFLAAAKEGAFSDLRVGVVKDGAKEMLWDEEQGKQLRTVDVIRKASRWIAQKQREIFDEYHGSKFLPCWGVDKAFETFCARENHDYSVYAGHLEELLQEYFMPEGLPRCRVVGLDKKDVLALLQEHRQAMVKYADTLYDGARTYKGAHALGGLISELKQEFRKQS